MKLGSKKASPLNDLDDVVLPVFAEYADDEEVERAAAQPLDEDEASIFWEDLRREASSRKKVYGSAEANRVERELLERFGRFKGVATHPWAVAAATRLEAAARTRLVGDPVLPLHTRARAARARGLNADVKADFARPPLLSTSRAAVRGRKQDLVWQRGLEPTYAATPARPGIAARVSASRRARAVASAAMCKGALVGELVDGAEMPAGLECKSLPSFTRAEVAEHRHDLVIVEDRVYDAAKFMWAHPAPPLWPCSARGGTLTFQSYHMREFPHGKMAPYLVGVLDAREAPALIGLNVQHDANHGAMFKDGRKNALWGLAQSWIGGSQLMWLQEHVVLHHMHTGDAEFDPDAQLAPVMRGHAGAPWLPWMRFQQFYFLLVELGYGVIPMFMSFFEVLCWRHKFERKFALSRLAWRWGLQSVALHSSSTRAWSRRPSPRASGPPRRTRRGAAAARASPRSFAKVAVTVGVASGYLAFFFFLSHNFDGVHFVAGAGESGDQRYPERSGFLHQQASSSSNALARSSARSTAASTTRSSTTSSPRRPQPLPAHRARRPRLLRAARRALRPLRLPAPTSRPSSAYLAKFSSPDYDAPVPKPEGPKAD
ncbi:fatty acid desaturase [Aureococcus anophagefferens]|uniref:Fatty acid desaturase n=1 Tax=Aureococcus anophagefferens TaxID=44056 RepID=A0ABR1G724_AURAN